MIRALRRRGPAALGVGLAAVLIAATGCGGESGNDAASGGGGKIALTVNVFGNFGYQDLYKQFEASHPNITITERGTGSDLSNYTPALTKNLAAGSGAGDVVALEEGIMIQFKQQAAELRRPRRSTAANDDKANFLPWKFEGGAVRRRQEAHRPRHRRRLHGHVLPARPVPEGRPADRPGRGGKLWPTWDDYVSVGNQFKAKNTGAKWFDAGVQHATTRSWCRPRARPRLHLLRQGQQPRHRLQPGDQAGVRPDAGDDRQGPVRRLQAPSPTSGTPASSRARSRRSPARPGCSATSRVRPATPTRASGTSPRRPARAATGAAPGSRVPTQSKHPKEAAELVRFLTSPKGQVAAFKSVNALPSSPVALDDPAIKAFKNAVLQRRSGRRDLRDRRQAAEAGLLRTEEPGRAGRGGEHAAGRRSRASSSPRTPGPRPSRTRSRPRD